MEPDRPLRRACLAAAALATIASLLIPIGVSWGSSPALVELAHQQPAGPTFIGWRAVLDAGTMTWLGRIPVTIARHGPDGVISDDIRAEERSSREARFTGQDSGRILDLACALSTCKVPPEAVLKAFP
jgi:hypothetical protein